MGEPPFEIQRADPRARKLALTITGFALGLALLLYVFSDPLLAALRSYLAQNIDLIIRERVLSIGVGLLFTSPFILFSIYFFFLGSRMVTERRSPLPDQRVTRDTRVYSGQAAVTRGRVAQALATVLMFASITVPILLWIMLDKIATGT